MKTHFTFSVANANAIGIRVQAVTRFQNKEIFLEMFDAPKEEIGKCIIEKMGITAWNFRKKAEFLNYKYKLLDGSGVKVENSDITDLFLTYEMCPDIERNGETIAHKAAAENNKLFLQILRYQYSCKLSAYNSLGKTPLKVVIAHGNKDVTDYLWLKSNMAKLASDNSSLLHYAVKYGNESLTTSAYKPKNYIDINQPSPPENYTALHVVTIFRQGVMSILIQ